MENQKSSATQIMLNYGLMLAIISILINVVNYSFGDIYEPHWSIRAIGFILMVAFITLGIKKFKESNGGLLKLGEAIKIGLGISLISGLVSVIYTYIFTSFLEPEFFTTMLQIQEQAWIEAGMDDASMDAARSMTEKMMGPGVTSAFIMIFSLFVGFIISLISGLIMKKSGDEVTSI